MPKTKRSNARKHQKTVYSHLYDRIKGAALEECWYCGQRRQCIDHCPPLAFLEAITTRKFESLGLKLLLIPSCNDCNLTLSNKLLLTPEERLSYIYEQLTKQLRKKPVWTANEIKALGYNMKSEVKSHERETKRLADRLTTVEKNLLEREFDK